MKAIRRQARRLGLQHERVANEACDQPSIGLARAFEFAVREFVRFDDDLSLLLHGDVFACDTFPIRALFEGTDVLAVPELRRDEARGTLVAYPWSGFIGLRVQALPEPGAIRFGPTVVSGLRCDTGGEFGTYLSANPAVRVGAVVTSDEINASNGNLALLPGEIGPPPEGIGVERVAGGLLHYLRGSDWDRRGETFHREKGAWLFGLLDRLLGGEVTMPPLPDQVTAPWPAGGTR